MFTVDSWTACCRIRSDLLVDRRQSCLRDRLQVAGDSGAVDRSEVDLLVADRAALDQFAGGSVKFC